jgi:ribosomal protein L37AE/L43A
MNHICPHCGKKTKQPDRRGGSFVLTCQHCRRRFQTNTVQNYAHERAQGRYGKRAGGDK